MDDGGFCRSNGFEYMENVPLELMHTVLQDEDDAPDAKKLHEKMTAHEDFDKERFWRFNLNKLNQLLYRHYAKHPHLSSIEDIHKELKKKSTKDSCPARSHFLGS